MTHEEAEARDAILKRLAESRAEIQRLLEPPPEDAPAARWAPRGAPNDFPRSRIMKKLMTGPGLGVVSAVVGGLMLARPRLAWWLIRLLPMSSLARSLMMRALSALQPKQE